METISLITAIISLLASLVTLFAVLGNISNFYYNYKHFKKGGTRVIFNSGAYQIYSGFMQKMVYKSSDNMEDYTRYRGDGMLEKYEDIKPFCKWSWAHRFDDIRTPNYPIRLL